MSNKILSRQLINRTGSAGIIPTISTASVFGNTELYDGEFFLNTADNKLWVRADDEILDLSPKSHNDLSGLQGGTTGEYYHLTSASYAEISNLSSSYVRKDLTDSDTQDINGSLKLTGDIIAENYIISSSVLYVTTSFSSGSTRWGDSSTDTHQVTGSLLVTGSVGIDTNNLTEKLTIANNTKFTSLTTGGASGASLWTDTSNRAAFGNSLTNSETWITKRGASGVIKLGEYDFSATYITMLANGRVGIGTTSPSAQLHVSASGTTNDLLIGTNKLFVSASGNVGIGTNSPATILHTYGTSNTIRMSYDNTKYGEFSTDSSGNNLWHSTGFVQMAGDNSVGDLSGQANNDLKILGDPSGNVGKGVYIKAFKSGSPWYDGIRYLNSTNIPNLILVPDGGNVGIGTTTPSFSLDVSGSTRITDNLTVSGSTLLTGSLSLIGQETINGSLLLTGSANITNALTSSTALISGSGVNRLTVIGSGSTSPLFTVQGQDDLFNVSDSIGGDIFVVNDIESNPIFTVNSTGYSILNTAEVSAISAPTILYQFSSSIARSGVFDYYVEETLLGYSRAGNITAVWNNTLINKSELSTDDLVGSTSPLTFDMDITGSLVRLICSASSGAWDVKLSARFL